VEGSVKGVKPFCLGKKLYHVRRKGGRGCSIVRKRRERKRQEREAVLGGERGERMFEGSAACENRQKDANFGREFHMPVSQLVEGVNDGRVIEGEKKGGKEKGGIVRITRNPNTAGEDRVSRGGEKKSKDAIDAMFQSQVKEY